jgi:hypothetical protein
MGRAIRDLFIRPVGVSSRNYEKSFAILTTVQKIGSAWLDGFICR